MLQKLRARLQRLRLFARVRHLELVLGQLATCKDCGVVVAVQHVTTAVTKGGETLCKWCKRNPAHRERVS